MPDSGSHFAASFLKKIEQKTDQMIVSVFKKELSMLNHSDRPRNRPTVDHSSTRGYKEVLSSRQTPFQCCINPSINVDKQNQLTDQEGRRSRTPSPHHSKDALPYPPAKKRKYSLFELSNDPSYRNAVVLVEEDEPEIAETMQQIYQVDGCMKDARIYFPSWEDPGSVEICYADLECLAPEAYLSSAIMNFYIRYLQQHQCSTGKEGRNYHFFNTFFYQKLKAALLKNDRKTSFAEVRRWWKGVKLFERAYIFVPIHEALHWSLVIICIPDKKDEVGPIMLHLDSLGLHSSKSVFYNIRRFLIREWASWRKGEAISDLPLENKIWDNLPQSINAKTIEVPQQSNKYDCGLFVLYFIEQFIEKAPERFKKKDLAMFGKHWFKPLEASSLRYKIRKLLKEEFKKTKREKSPLGCLATAARDALHIQNH